MGEIINDVNEELNGRAKSKKISLKKKRQKKPYLLFRNGVGTFRKGSIVAITGRVKNGKTFTLSIFAAALLGDTSFKFESKMSDDEKVLYFDTEQEEDDVVEAAERIHMMLGWDINDDNDRFGVYYLGDTPRKERYKYIENEIKTVKPAAVFIDGIADLIYNFNDLVEANSIIENLIHLATEVGCVICCTLHTNENEHNDKMRGHLGSTFMQKTPAVFKSSKKGSNSFEVSNPISRHEVIGEIPFFLNTVNDKAIPVFKADMDMEKKENAYIILTEICKPGVTYQSKELKEEYQKYMERKKESGDDNAFYAFLKICKGNKFLDEIPSDKKGKFYKLIEQSKDTDKDLQDEDAPESNNIFYCDFLGADTTGYENKTSEINEPKK